MSNQGARIDDGMDSSLASQPQGSENSSNFFDADPFANVSSLTLGQEGSEACDNIIKTTGKGDVFHNTQSGWLASNPFSGDIPSFDVAEASPSASSTNQNTNAEVDDFDDILLLNNSSNSTYGNDGDNIATKDRGKKDIGKYLTRFETDSSDDEPTFSYTPNLDPNNINISSIVIDSEIIVDDESGQVEYDYEQADDFGEFEAYHEPADWSTSGGGSGVIGAEEDEPSLAKTAPTPNPNHNPRPRAPPASSSTYIKPLSKEDVDKIRLSMIGLKLSTRPGLDSLLNSAIHNKVYRLGDEIAASETGSGTALAKLNGSDK